MHTYFLMMKTPGIKKDFYESSGFDFTEKTEIITFNNPEKSEYTKHEYDWYIVVALEKADQVKIDRHLLTRELLLSYRWAIREGYNHQLDTNLKNRYDYPRNRNTIEGIKGYISLIQKRSEEEMKNI